MNATVPTLAEIEEARRRISGAALRTPLVRLNVEDAPAEIHLKLENRPSFVDGIGGRSVFPQMLERAKRLLDGALLASLPEVAGALKLLAERNRVIAEGAGACPVACALAGRGPPLGHWSRMSHAWRTGSLDSSRAVSDVCSSTSVTLRSGSDE